MALPRPFKLLAAELERSSRAVVPILGSGFVTQAAFSGAALFPPARGEKSPAPVDWISLLKGVASEFECGSATSHIHADVPGQTTLLWDAMVAELAGRPTADVSARGARKAAHVWESKMRRSVARRLREDVATVERSRPFVESFLRLGWDDVLSFNFDSVLLPPKVRPVHLELGAAKRASLVASVGKTRVWYPHGHLSEPDSIVLGAHAYGVRIAAMQAAFEKHARLAAPRPTQDFSSWVALLLERPLLFVGLSLTREEWTLWWLLSQRARFLARRPVRVEGALVRNARPGAYVFARRPASSDRLEAHAAFQTLSRACDLLGLTLLSFDDFATGWKSLRSALGWPE